MPVSSKHPCPGKGPRKGICPNIIGRGIPFCINCIPYAKIENAKYDRERDQAEDRQWLHSPRWIKASRMFRAEHPFCAECEREGRKTAAYLVDHIIPHQGNHELFWNESNWQPLCNEHHEKKHLAQRWKGRDRGG